MPKLICTAFEPIVIEIVGMGEYRIETISAELMDRFVKAAKNAYMAGDQAESKELAEILVAVLPGMTLEQAMRVDLRNVLRIADFLAQQIVEVAQPKTEKN